MDTTIIPKLTGKRARNSSVVLTDRMCEKRVSKRSRSTTANALAYMSASPWLASRPSSSSSPTHRPASSAPGGSALAETFRDRKVRQARKGKTVDEIIEERIAWMKTPVRKPDGEMRPRLESWENVASHLHRFLSPRIGKKIAGEVTKHDIATLSNDIVAGRHGVPSVANARHMRRAASGLFNWAAEAGRDYVTASPCVNLPKLDPEHPRTRVLSEEEIRIFWHGLDRDDLPWDRKTRLALKFELVTMLRSGELLATHRDELFDLDGDNPRFEVPLKRVKKRRVIQQPLSDLAVEIIWEALSDDEQQFVFASSLGDQPMNRKVMASALCGTKYKGKVKTPGICAMLGLRPFTPHDLRRTAATLAGDLGFDDAWIAKCLDHAASKKQEQTVPSVTGKVYNHSKRMKESARCWMESHPSAADHRRACRP
jgi:integrase